MLVFIMIWKNIGQYSYRGIKILICDIVHCYGFYICCTCSEELIQTINKMWNVRFVWMFV